MVDTNLTHSNQFAVLVSSPYTRSRYGPNKCFKFRYMLTGPGKKTLTIYHKANSHREIPIWISQHNTGHNWFYGQVPLSSVSKFQVMMDVVLSLPSLIPKPEPLKYTLQGPSRLCFLSSKVLCE